MSGMVRSAVAAGVVGVVAYFALGMPGMDHGSAGTEHDMSSMSSGADGGGELVELDPSALGVVINVHVPYAGEIPGRMLWPPTTRSRTARRYRPERATRSCCTA
jgi:hypothetical protein